MSILNEILYFVPFFCTRGYNHIKNMSKRTKISNNERVIDLQYYMFKAFHSVAHQ